MKGNGCRCYLPVGNKGTVVEGGGERERARSGQNNVKSCQPRGAISANQDPKYGDTRQFFGSSIFVP